MALIRRAGEGDLPALAALERENFPLGADGETMARLMADGRHVFFLAEEDGRAAGYGWYEFVLDEGGVGNLAVRPACRRRGLGRLLTEAMVSDARSRGLAFLTLEVRESNIPARRLYESCGFKTAGVRKNDYEKPAEDAVLMTIPFDKEATLC